jgi:hypothetical protein
MKGGSIKNKITNPDLQEERDFDSFDRKEMEVFLYTQKQLDRIKNYHLDIKAHPELKPDFKLYDMTREEKMEFAWKRNNMVASIDRKRYFDNATDF